MPPKLQTPAVAVPGKPRGKLPSVTELDGRAERLSREPSPPKPLDESWDADDTDQRSADSLVLELAARTRTEAELRRQLALAQQAAQSPVKPPAVEIAAEDVETARALSAGRRWGSRVAPKLAWLLGAIGALGAVGSAGVIGGQVALNPRPAKQENVDVANERLESLEKWRKSIAPWQAYDYGDRAAKETLLLDFLCLQGFRPEGLPCQDVHDRARQLRTDRVTWPSPRLPPNPEQR